MTGEVTIPATRPARGGLVCREIREADLPALAVLLREGFPDRTLGYWQDGLRRLAAHAAPPGVPRFGWLLAAGGEAVGVMLLIHARPPEGGGIRGNVSSWYVRPAYLPYAALLNQRAVRDPAVTYVNVSPAKHTLPAIKALGFSRATAGLFAGLPALAAPRRGVTVSVVADASTGMQATSERSSGRSSGGMSAAEARLLAAHAQFGCLCLWLRTPDGGHPFVFRRRVLRRGRLPCAMLIHCRSLALLERYAGPLGRVLAWHGMPLLMAGADRALCGVPGRLFADKLAIYRKGPLVPRGGDLSYTEAALFGM